MEGDPRIDGRRRTEFAEHARAIAPAFTDQWSSGQGDVGDALVELFGDLAEDVAERLDRVPEKHRVSFFDTVGFDRNPPQPAELPVAVEVAAGIGRNVRIPSGTQATADATEERPELVFETQSAFEATPARLTDVLSVDPERDLIVDHSADVVAGSAETLFSTAPADQVDAQRHALYVGHESRLDLGPETTLTVDLETHADRDAIETLVWEYVGEPPEDGDGAAGGDRERGGEGDGSGSGSGDGSGSGSGVGDGGGRGSGDGSGRGNDDGSGGSGAGDGGDDGPQWQSFDVRSIERRGVEVVTREEAVTGVEEFVERRGEAVRSSLAEPGELHQRADLLNELLEAAGFESRTAAAFEAMALPSIGQLAGLTAIAPDPTRRAAPDATGESRRVDRDVEHRRHRDERAAERGHRSIESSHDGRAIERIAAEGRADRHGFAGRVGEVVAALEAASGVEAFRSGSSGADHGFAAVFETDDGLRLDERGAVEAFDDLAEVHAIEEPARVSDDDLRAFAGHLLGELAGGPIDEFPTVEPPTYYRITLRPPTPVESATVADVETRWLRARIPTGAATPALFALQVGPARATSIELDGPPELGPIRLGSSVDDGPPDRLLANDVPLPSAVDGEAGPVVDGTTRDAGERPDRTASRMAVDEERADAIRPFGDWPRLQDAFYVASRDAFTKGGTEATVAFAGAPPPDDPDGTDDVGGGDGSGAAGSEQDDEPQLSWEYYDGDGWSRLTLESDGTERLRGDGAVRFEVPRDLEPTTVAGHEEHWIRVRLVGGDYGDLTARRSAGRNGEEWTTIRDFDPPTYGAVTVSYEDLDAPTHVVPENGLAYGRDQIAAERATYAPFHRPPEDGQTVYLGFDAPLRDGPITLLVDPADVAYPTTFHPRVRWEYCVDPDADRWRRLDASDGTRGLTERGVVGLGFPAPTTAVERFNRERHWIRARVTRDRFEREEWATTDLAEAAIGAVPPPCDAAVETEPPTGPPRRRLPTIERLVPNAAWARNERRIGNEVLGSSDGRPDQTMRISRSPVADAAVWVDERESLTADRRARLRQEEPERIEIEGPSEQPDAVWVRWIERDDLLESGSEDRHYEIDAVTGEVTFGDGERGEIPPPGVDNVRATYSTGGGAHGNVEPGAVGGLRRSIEFVEDVTNPIAGDGGADAEATAAVLERAPKALRDRGRAVTAADVERVAASASRELERVRCFPGMDEAGAESPGWVTLLVVPEGTAKRPTPSVTLKHQVERAVLDRAPHLVAATGQLAVRGPGYVPVSVETTLVTDESATVGAVEEAAADELDAFLHPLTGGPEGAGWAFGELPCPSALYGLLEPLDGVDHVADLVVRFRGVDDVVEVREGDETPSVSADALVHSGDHDVVGRLGARPSAAGGR